MPGDADAIVVGSGPNGLAAAVTLAAAGLRVHVIEGAASPGGGCRTEELTLPGFRHDARSAAHPLALASPSSGVSIRPRGASGSRTRTVVYAHPLDGGRAAVVTRSVADTAAGLGRDEAAYRRPMQPLAGGGNAIADAVLLSTRRPTASPPARSPTMPGWASLRGRGGPAFRHRGSPRPVRRRGHARDAAADGAAYGRVGLLLGSLAHTVGWPLVVGGSGRRLTPWPMSSSPREASGDRPLGSVAGGFPPARAVLLDVSPRAFLGRPGERCCSATATRWPGSGTGQASGRWTSPCPARFRGSTRRPGGGTLHLGGGFEEIAAAEAAVARGEHPESPYVLVVQAGVADPTRAPEGQHTLWAYCHVPAGSAVDMAARIEAQIERFAPGFADLVLARNTRTAVQEEAMNPNYVGGDIAWVRRPCARYLARPVARWNPYRTPLRGVYLCSAATPPGPAAHGRCGELAALTALREASHP